MTFVVNQSDWENVNLTRYDEEENEMLMMMMVMMMMTTGNNVV